MPTCNICQGQSFEAGPGGRLTASGLPPRCTSCNTLERHRSLRKCMDSMPREFLAGRRALQFAPDGSLDPRWFLSYEGSQYDGENSLDLQRIDRPSESYDFISLSGVLEFVTDDRQAFRELLRIASSVCVLHCTFVPFDETLTYHREPHGPYGRRHGYGADLDDWFEIQEHDLISLVVVGADPVTGIEEAIHFFCRRAQDADVFRDSLLVREQVGR
jgi:hypothetical protein